MKAKTTISTLLGLLCLSFILNGCEPDSLSSLFPPGTGDPILNVSTLDLAFDSNDMQQDLVISNAGGDTLEWELSDYPNWVEPSAGSGAVLYSTSETVTFHLQRQLLDPGDYQGDISLTSNGGDTTIQIELIIYNAGADTLSWSLSVDDTLFTPSLDSGETVQQTSVTVTFDREYAPYEEISATLTVETDTEIATVVLAADNSWQLGQWLSHIGQTVSTYPARQEDFFYIVRFDAPEELDDYVIDSLSACFYTASGAFDFIQFFCWDVGVDIFGNVVPNLDFFYYGTNSLDPVNGWNTWAVEWSLDLETFCIGYLQENATPFPYPWPYYDSTVQGQYSYLIKEDAFGLLYIELVLGWEWCIEVHVTPEQPGQAASHTGHWIKPEIETIRTFPGKPTAEYERFSRHSTK
jgi:hypothetical protein